MRREGGMGWEGGDGRGGGDGREGIEKEGGDGREGREKEGVCRESVRREGEGKREGDKGREKGRGNTNTLGRKAAFRKGSIKTAKQY